MGSFRETTHVENGSRKGSSGFCSECQIERNCSRPMTPPVSPQSATFYSNNGLPPVQKAIVKAFSIDKLRPLCPVCNPAGDVPYPACSLPSPPKLPRNNNFRFIMDVFETVNNTQVLVATNWTGMKVGSLEQEVTLGAWGLLPDSDYIISVRAKNEKGESSPVYVGGSTRITEGATWLPINDNKTEAQGRMPLLFVIVGVL